MMFLMNPSHGWICWLQHLAIAQGFTTFPCYEVSHSHCLGLNITILLFKPFWVILIHEITWLIWWRFGVQFSDLWVTHVWMVRVRPIEIEPEHCFDSCNFHQCSLIHANPRIGFYPIYESMGFLWIFAVPMGDSRGWNPGETRIFWPPQDALGNSQVTYQPMNHNKPQ